MENTSPSLLSRIDLTRMRKLDDKCMRRRKPYTLFYFISCILQVGIYKEKSPFATRMYISPYLNKPYYCHPEMDKGMSISLNRYSRNTNLFQTRIPSICSSTTLFYQKDG